MKDRVSYFEAIHRMSRRELIAALDGLSAIASEPVLKAMRERKQPHEVADAVAAAVRERVLRVFKRTRSRQKTA